MKRVVHRFAALAAVVGVAALAGCTEGVLDPKGPIAVAERQILFNALGIMLAIAIPTILATLGVAALLHEPSVSEVARALGLELAAGHRDPVDLITARGLLESLGHPLGA